MTTVSANVDTTDELPIRQLRELARVRKADDLVDEQLAEAVDRACQAGARWSAIAQALETVGPPDLEVAQSWRKPA